MTRWSLISPTYREGEGPAGESQRAHYHSRLAVVGGSPAPSSGSAGSDADTFRVRGPDPRPTASARRESRTTKDGPHRTSADPRQTSRRGSLHLSPGRQPYHPTFHRAPSHRVCMSPGCRRGLGGGRQAIVGCTAGVARWRWASSAGSATRTSRSMGGGSMRVGGVRPASPCIRFVRRHASAPGRRHERTVGWRFGSTAGPFISRSVRDRDAVPDRGVQRSWTPTPPTPARPVRKLLEPDRRMALPAVR